MDRVLLRRDGGDVVAADCAPDGTPGPATRVLADELPSWVAAREGEGTVRWVWDDTTRWYPALLDAGVRVERCTDLRLTGALLRRSPLADPALLAGGDAAGWAALEPRAGGGPAPAPPAGPARPRSRRLGLRDRYG
ncbi:hypothetical protein ACWKWC_21135, partial [Geodermatophilus nigrescens]